MNRDRMISLTHEVGSGITVHAGGGSDAGRMTELADLGRAGLQ